MRKNNYIFGGFAATTAITLATVGTPVQAEEVTATVETATTVAEVPVTAATVQSALEVAEQAQASVDAQQIVVEAAKGSLETAEQATSQAKEQLTKAEEKVAQATPENIQNAEDAVENAKTNQVTKETAVETSQDAVKEAQDAVNNQAKVVESAKKVISKEQADVDAAQQKVNTAESAFDSATLLQAQQEAGSLDAKVKEEQKTVSDLTSNLASKEQEQRDLIANGTKKRQELEQAVTSAGPEYYTEVVEREIATHQVSESDAVSTPKDPTFIGNDGKTYYVVANENVLFDGEKVETIVLPNKEAFNQRKTVDYKKVSEYVREYIVELRRINGIDIPVPEVTESALKWAKARTDEMAKNDKFSHDTVLNPADFNLLGETENISLGSLHAKSNLDERQIAYNVLLRYFNDFSNASLYGAENPEEGNIFNYGHRTPLLGATGTGFAIQNTDGYSILTFVSTTDRDVYGVLPSNLDESVYSISEYDGKMYKNPPYSSYFLARAENKDSDPLRSEYYFNGKRIKFLPKTTFRYVWEETLYHKNTKREDAVTALNNFNNAQKIAEEKITNIISSMKSELVTAQNILSTDENALKVANNRVTALTSDNADKVRILKEAQNELTTQQSELKSAKEVLTKEEEELIRLEGLRDKAQKNLTQAETGLEEAKKAVRSAEQELLDLQNAPEKLEEAKENYAKSQQQLKEAKETFDDASALLETLLTERDTKLSEYKELKAKFDLNQAKLKDLENQAKNKVIVTLPDGTIVAVPKDAPTTAEKPAIDVDTVKQALDKGQDVKVVDGKVVVTNPQAGVTVTQTATGEKVTYSRVERAKTLPNTGEQTSLLALAGVAVLSSLGLASARRRKQG
ncbi:LPXTG cell wall surface protein [Streptococcus suis]|uniref:LPXTG cell wall surface protein n=1 Tax=Streptococcus suis TaxID=1307 RepID=A0A0Z8GI34_STRSU|nr:LPXTG cell wall anchor domain-containing protein [Streptococcus suis]NQH35784.1 LPXTG cell wall anchor domain-containing protein [Streptococcus suis]CYU99200.1 LPXTG cell wall surface protein [Streptococcus suis]